MSEEIKDAYTLEKMLARVQLADEFSKVTGYPPSNYYDTITDLRHALSELSAAKAHDASLRAELERVKAELELERKATEAWHLGHWKADMEAVKSYKDIAAKAIENAQQAEKDRDSLKAELEAYRMVAEMCAADDMFYSQWNEKTQKHDGAYPVILCNDTFFYATADGEPVSWETVPEVYALWKKGGHPALVEWISQKRGIKPLSPKCEMSRLEQANAEITALRKAGEEAVAELEQFKMATQRLKKDADEHYEARIKAESSLAQARAVVGAAKKARAGGPYTPMFDALDELARAEEAKPSGEIG